MRKWLRVLICLLLVCCILVNLSPLRAEAVSATAIACSVAIPVAVAIGLQAVGVRQGSDSTAFNNVVSSAVDALSSEWAVNGLTTMLALTTDGLTKTFAPQNFLQSLLDFLFGNKVLTSSDAITLSTSGSYSVGSDAYSWSASSDSFVVCLTKGTYSYIYAFGNGSFVQNGSSVSLSSGPTHGYWYKLLSSTIYVVSGLPIYPVPSGYTWADDYFKAEWPFVFGSSVTTDQDLTLESVGHDIDTDYETYVETGIVGVDFGVQFEDDPNTNRNEEDDGNDLWLPVGIPGQLSGGSYIDQTQQDAQSGNTPQDVLDELLQNSGSGDGTGDSTGDGSGTNTGTWKPGEMSNFFLDLSKYFPFCIPFDLYDFFTCLNAAPQAPVISWEIPLPGGSTYPMEIDLSPFDEVAQLLRRLQLLLFCTGLAFKTRDLIKG